MNIYDTKIVKCHKCDKCIGEVDFDAKVIHPLCGNCGNPLSKGFDNFVYSKNQIISSEYMPVSYVK